MLEPSSFFVIANFIDPQGVKTLAHEMISW